MRLLIACSAVVATVLVAGCADSGSLFDFGSNDSAHVIKRRVDEQSEKRQQGALPQAQPDPQDGEFRA